jgi:hypothetical protein
MPNVQFKVANIAANNLGRVALQAPHFTQLSAALNNPSAKLTALTDQYKLGDVTLAAHGIDGVEGHVLQLANTALGTLDVDSVVDAE